MILARLVMPQDQKENVENHNEQNFRSRSKEDNRTELLYPLQKLFRGFVRIIPIVRNHLLRAT